MFKKYSYYLPSLGESWLMAAILIVAGGLLGNVIQLLLISIFPNIDIGLVSKVISYIVMFIPVLWFISVRSKNLMIKAEVTGTEAERIKLNEPYFGKLHPILFFVIIFFALFAVSIMFDPITSLMKMPEWFEQIMSSLVGGKFIYSLLAVSVLAPLCEEFFCRGIIMRGLLKHINPAGAILWSALIFAVIHLNPWQAVPAFILGVFFGWVYYKTKCLWATIFLHCVNNSFSLAMNYIYPDMDMDMSFASLFPDKATYWLVFAIAVGVAALAFFLITKYVKPKKDDEKVIPA